MYKCPILGRIIHRLRNMLKINLISIILFKFVEKSKEERFQRNSTFLEFINTYLVWSENIRLFTVSDFS